MAQGSKGYNPKTQPPGEPYRPDEFVMKDERMRNKQKYHRENFRVIRRFAKGLREYASPDVDTLYQVAKQTGWVELVDYNLKTFIKSYLTDAEKELFNISYREWMIIEVESQVMVELGIGEEEEEFDYNDNLEVVVSAQDIESLVKSLGQTITEDYEHEPYDLVLLGVLKGSVLFYSDLIRTIELPILSDFVQISSYRNGTKPSDIRIAHDHTMNLEGRNVIIVEDIVDTGHTINVLLDRLKSFNPRSVKVCTLLDKPSRRESPVDIHYCGIRIPNVFVVGYGLDHCEHYRNLKDVCKLQ